MPPKKRRLVCGALLWLCAAAWLPMCLAAQAVKGVLAGVVVDSQGQPVAAASVYFQDAEGKTPHLVRTDANGRFRSRLLNADLYEVRAESGGRWSEWAHNVIVRGGSEETLTLRLLPKTAPGKN